MIFFGFMHNYIIFVVSEHLIFRQVALAPRRSIVENEMKKTRKWRKFSISKQRARIIHHGKKKSHTPERVMIDPLKSSREAAPFLVGQLSLIDVQIL